MKSERKIRLHTCLFILAILWTGLSTRLIAGEKQWIVIYDNIAPEVQRIPVKLKFSQSNSRFYDTSQHGIKSEVIEESRRKDDYKQKLTLGTMVDGNRYVVMIKEFSEVNIISQNSDRLCMAKVLRYKDNEKKADTVMEGLMALNQDLEIPVTVAPEQLHVPFNEPLKGVLEINIYNSNDPLYAARYQTSVTGSLSGSTSIENAFLEASITSGGSNEQKNWSVNLNVKPFDDKIAPASGRGSLTETLTLGSAKLVVEKIAADSSELVLAHLGGDWVQERKMDETMAVVGKPFPPFARVDLIKRRLLTLDDLKKEAGPDGYVVLIFGDFKMQMNMQPYFGGMPPMRNLSLDDSMITRILKKGSERPIVIGFICQQFSIADLYGKWLGEDPEFHVLSDYSNPLNIIFVGLSMEPQMYHRQMQQRGEETFRANLKVKNENVITALIDGNGDLVYWNDNAGNELSASLVQINKLMQEGKKAKPNQ